jgi:hypothetical protein
MIYRVQVRVQEEWLVRGDTLEEALQQLREDLARRSDPSDLEELTWQVTDIVDEAGNPLSPDEIPDTDISMSIKEANGMNELVPDPDFIKELEELEKEGDRQPQLWQPTTDINQVETMTVADLIETLRQCNPSATVQLAIVDDRKGWIWVGTCPQQPAWFHSELLNTVCLHGKPLYDHATQEDDTR